MWVGIFDDDIRGGSTKIVEQRVRQGPSINDARADLGTLPAQRGRQLVEHVQKFGIVGVRTSGAQWKFVIERRCDFANKQLHGGIAASGQLRRLFDSGLPSLSCWINNN